MTGIIVRSFAFSQAKSSRQIHVFTRAFTADDCSRIHRAASPFFTRGGAPGAATGLTDRAGAASRGAGEPGARKQFYEKIELHTPRQAPRRHYRHYFTPHRFRTVTWFMQTGMYCGYTAVAIHQQRSAAHPTLARATPPHRERTLSHQFRALDGHLKKLARPRTNNRSAVQFRDAAAGATRATPRQGHHMERRPRGRLGDRVDGI